MARLNEIKWYGKPIVFMDCICDKYQTSYGANHTLYHLNMPKLGLCKHEIEWKWKGPKNSKWTEANMFQNVMQTSIWKHKSSIKIGGPFSSQKQT